MPNPNHPCIVIPGIKGAGLENIYALPPATTWSAGEAGVVVPDFDSLALESNTEAVAHGSKFKPCGNLISFRRNLKSRRARGWALRHGL